MDAIDRASIQIASKGLYYFSYELNVGLGVPRSVGFRITVNYNKLFDDSSAYSVVEESTGGELTLVSNLVGRYYRAKATFSMYEIA